MHRTGYHHGRRYAFAPAAALLLALCLLAGGAQALLTPPDDAALARGADEIVRGEITGVESRWTDDHARIETTATVRVTARAKGGGPDTLALTVPGGTVGDTSLWVEDQPGLVEGTEAFLFVEHGPAGDRVYGGVEGVVPVENGRVRGGKEKGGGVTADAYGEYVAAIARGEARPAPAAGPAPRAAGATTPVIASVSPSTASAGTETTVTITGSGFGEKPSRESTADVGFTYRYSGSTVHPIWASGCPSYDANEDDILSWTDTEIVVRVPAGRTSDGYRGAASSGAVWVLSEENVASGSRPFTVTFAYGEERWNGTTAYAVNPEGMDPALAAAITNAGASWNAALPAGSPQFVYAGESSETTGIFEQDGVNLISFESWIDILTEDALAVTAAWSTNGTITEVDTAINPSYAWTAGTANATVWNLETVVQHELGHWLRLCDLYGWVPGYPSDASEAMFGYCGDVVGNRNRHALAPDDVAGVRWIYAGGAPPPAAPAPRPYPGPHPVPGAVEAEDFDAGGEGVAYHDADTANLGGAYRPSEGVDLETSALGTNVGWVRSGEWLSYTVVATAPQSVVLHLCAANPDAEAKQVRILVGGELAGSVRIPSTGSFETWATTDSGPIWLPAGPTPVRLVFDGVERVNLDWFVLVPAGTADPALPKPTPTPTPPVPTPTPTPALLIGAPGSYTLDRDLTGAWNGVVITSPDVVLDGNGHAVAGPGETPAYGAGWGVAILGTQDASLANVTVRNLSVRDWNDGFHLERVTGSTVEGVVSGASRTGCYLVYAENTTVRDSVFRDCTGAGMHLDFQAGVTVDRCRAVNNSVGIMTSSVGTVAYPLLVRGSEVSGNAGPGIVVADGGYLGGIVNCTVSENGAGGVHIDMSEISSDEFFPGGGTIEGNRIEGNAETGIGLSDWPGVAVSRNRVEGNGVGLWVAGRAGPRVWDNLFNNTVALDLAEATAPPVLNATRAPGPNVVGGPSIGGNYWAAPDGSGFSETHADSDGDGFVDASFAAGTGAVDLLPLARWTGPRIAAVPPGTAPPTDADADGVYDDVNGNGRADFADVVLYFNQMSWIAAHEPLAAFDCNGNGRIDFADVVWLFNRL